MSTEPEKYPGFTLEENLKKAVTELLILVLLSEENRYINELTSLLNERSHGILSVVFPYGAVYRLEESGYIEECGKKVAPDGRRRQYYRITDTGRIRLQQLLKTYRQFSKGVAAVLEEGDNEK